MRIDIITLFPSMFDSPFAESIIKRAREKGIVEIELHYLRDYATSKHGTVDDTPYGGGAGMVLKVDVVDKAIAGVRGKGLGDRVKPYSILTTPQGQVFKQAKARELSDKEWLIVICGHYEGYDERIRSLADEEISIGDYVLTGGELPAMVIVDAVTRLLPGVLGKEESHKDDSHESGLLEYPHYTRPEEYKGQTIPDILKSGNHLAIEVWRKEEALKRTKERRPDLLSN